MNDITAHEQWRSRPADERYWSLSEMYAQTAVEKNVGQDIRIRPNELQFDADANGRLVMSARGLSCDLTHWSFGSGQLASLLGAGDAAQMFRRQPADLVARNLNWAASNASREEMKMLYRPGGELSLGEGLQRGRGTARAFNTTVYGRLWNADVLRWIMNATGNESNGWHRPPSYTDKDGMPGGYYLSDRNMFVFMVNEDRTIDDGQQGMNRGFYVWNTEVGQMSFGFKAFLFQRVCGNHIIWGAEQLFSLRIVHMGERLDARTAVTFAVVAQKYLDAGIEMDQAVISAARGKEIAQTKPEAVDWLTGKKVGFTPKEAGEIVAYTESKGQTPTILWALICAATELSQKKFAWQDSRNAWDRKASAMLNFAL